MEKKLTVLAVKTLKKPGLYSDEGNLHVLIEEKSRI